MAYSNEGWVYPLATRSILVRVEFIASIDIPHMNDRSVFIPSITRLNIRYKNTHNEIFVHAIGPLSFNWKINLQGIFDLKYPSKNDNFKGLSSLMTHK